MEKVWLVLIKLKVLRRSHLRKVPCSRMVTARVIITVKIQKQPKRPSRVGRLSTLWNMHLVEYYLVMKKTHSTTWINLTQNVL